MLNWKEQLLKLEFVNIPDWIDDNTDAFEMDCVGINVPSVCESFRFCVETGRVIVLVTAVTRGTIAVSPTDKSLHATEESVFYFYIYFYL